MNIDMKFLGSVQIYYISYMHTHVRYLEVSVSLSSILESPEGGAFSLYCTMPSAKVDEPKRKWWKQQDKPHKSKFSDYCLGDLGNEQILSICRRVRS